MPVFIGEPVDEIKRMFFWRLPTRVLKRHQLLEGSDRFLGSYMARQAFPSLTVLRSLAILRCDKWDLPYGLVEDWAKHFAALSGGNQGADEIVEGCPQVVEDVSHDKLPVRIGSPSELQRGNKLAVLVLDGIRNCVWVLGRKGIEQQCQVDEMPLAQSALRIYDGWLTMTTLVPPSKDKPELYAAPPPEVR